MNTRLTVYSVGFATSLFLLVTYVLCVGFDLLFPEMAMYPAWQRFLPGFTWISPASFALGAAEVFAYGWYFAIVWVPLLKLFSRRRDQA